MESFNRILFLILAVYFIFKKIIYHLEMKKYTLQTAPFIVPTTDGKRIAEHHGLASTSNTEISIAHMIAPQGGVSPFRHLNLMNILLLFVEKTIHY